MRRTDSAQVPIERLSALDPPKDPLELRKLVAALRAQLDAAFRPDTAINGTAGVTRSTGHCAAVAAIVAEVLGAALVSAWVADASHWFNRITVGLETLDLDLTGDQFGYSPVRTAKAGTLFEGTRLRSPGELNRETLERARRLAERAGLSSAATALARRIERSVAPNGKRTRS